MSDFRIYPYTIIIRKWSPREREIILGQIIQNAKLIYCTNKSLSVNYACHLAVNFAYQVSPILNNDVDENELFQYIYTQCVMDPANGAYHLDDWKLERAKYFGDTNYMNHKERYSEILSKINRSEDAAEKSKLWRELHKMREGFNRDNSVEAISDAIYKAKIKKRA